MSWTISCVTNVRVLAAEASLRRSFVPASRACSTTASSAGCRFIRGPVASTTNRSSRKGPIVQGRYHSAGAKPTCSSHRAYSSASSFITFFRFHWFLYIFILEKLNILRHLAFTMANSAAVLFTELFLKVELRVVKMCHYLCSKCLLVCIVLVMLLQIFLRCLTT